MPMHLITFDELSTYELDSFFVPTCVFKIVDKNPSVIDVLRYGTILTDDELLDETNAHVRIKVLSYGQNVYYIKTVNGEIIGFEKVGVVG